MAYKLKMGKFQQEMIKGIEKRIIKEIGEELVNEILKSVGAKSLCEAVENYNIHEKNDPIRAANHPVEGYTEAGAIRSSLRIAKILTPGYFTKTKST